MEGFYLAAMEQFGDNVVADARQIDNFTMTYISSTSPHLIIKFVLGYFPLLSFHFLKQGSTQPELVKMAKLPLRETPPLVMRFEQFSDPDTARRLIGEKLDGLIVTANLRRQMTEMALDSAWASVKSKPPKHNVVSVRVHAAVLFEFDFGQRTPVFEEKMCRVFADYTIDVGDDELDLGIGEFGRCAICLKNFVGRDECVSTVCAHDFHGECLERWLGINRTCPVCRSQIPS